MPISELGEYQKAIQYYEKGLEISTGEYHWQSISLGEYEKAIEFSNWQSVKSKLAIWAMPISAWENIKKQFNIMKKV